MKLSRQTIGLGIALVLIGGVITFLELKQPNRSPAPAGSSAVAVTDRVNKAARFDPAREIINPSGFVNTDGITIGNRIGTKVILVDFWTYSCINCQRTLPYLTSWYQKYRDQGLEIVGVHTPEFEFEKEIENVRQAARQWGIKYPVVLDNDYGTWNAYANRYWPHKYLIDVDGYIVYDHIGEGGYEETERKIQELLEERKTVLNEAGSVPKDIAQPAAEAVTDAMPRSPEIYFGAARNQYLGNGQSGRLGIQMFDLPVDLKLNTLYLAGDWDLQNEYAQNSAAGAKIVFRYQAQKVFIVAHADAPVRLRLTLDGQPVTSAAGSDVTDGVVTVKDSRLYRLIEDAAWAEHTLEIEVLDAGLQAFTFTFG